jgi:hypothetical protein
VERLEVSVVPWRCKRTAVLSLFAARHPSLHPRIALAQVEGSDNLNCLLLSCYCNGRRTINTTARSATKRWTPSRGSASRVCHTF